MAVALAAGGCGSDRTAGTDRAGTPGSAAGGSARPASKAPLLVGGEHVVFIGDSLSVEAPPSYPELLPEALAHRAPGVTVTNLGEPGTTAADWLPGTPLFEQRLAPELERADLVAVTLGGNDLQEALGGSDGIDALSGSSGDATTGSEQAFAALSRLRRRLKRIYGEIRERAPGARIVFVGYPDYSRGTAWGEAAGVSGTVALGLGLSALVDAAENAGPDLLIDMREPTAAAGIDSLLADTEHLGPAGHELYANEIARTLTKRR